ncbi:hypothetical protein HMPREF1979_01008 [Actinomyces johnsonii F0542]|uniref:Uncharacterized protein n=1 Tax=Actinomyces johnsonii F0542 TaxID=1321818 RepID=U1RZ26_9ACTO|nr:hypothetical protein HMPREF1979_01008 [Actinomyces johnsonii F0542]
MRWWNDHIVLPVMDMRRLPLTTVPFSVAGNWSAAGWISTTALPSSVISRWS